MGEGPLMPTPREIGEAMDVAINVLSAKEPQSEVLADSVMKRMKILDLPHLGVRAKNCLISEGIDTLYDLTRVHRGDLMKIRRLGKKTFKEICDLMKDYQLEFAKK